MYLQVCCDPEFEAKTADQSLQPYLAVYAAAILQIEFMNEFLVSKTCQVDLLDICSTVVLRVTYDDHEAKPCSGSQT